MDRIWTQEDRDRQAKAVKNWKPWQESTGPKTEGGKAVSCQNALKHGVYSKNFKALNKSLKKQTKWLEDLDIS